jgi:hypothetical protein
MNINTLDTKNLESERSDLEDTLDSLIYDIPDSGDEGYVAAAEALIDWLGITEANHLEFIGGQVWLDGPDECLCHAAPDSEAAELGQLNALRDEILEWNSGVTLIDEDSFEKYAQEYARETGSRDLDSWPNEHIDWAAAAEALGENYDTVEFRDTTYRYRA